MPGDSAHQPARWHDPLFLDAGPRAAEAVASSRKRHHDLFDRRVAGSLTDTVDGDFDLASAGRDRGQGVGGRHPEIVVAMNRDDRVFDPGHVFLQVGHQIRVFGWGGVPDGIRHVEGCCAGFDGAREDLDKVIPVGTSGIFSRELDVIDQRMRQRDHFADPLEYVLARHLQFVLEMDIRGGNEGVDPGLFRPGHRFATLLDIFAIRAGQTSNACTLDAIRDELDRLEIALERPPESPLR